MDDLDFGTRDQRGYWRPKMPEGIAPLWSMPPRPMAILRWLPSYFLPWNLLFLATAAMAWAFLTPSNETLATLSWGWIAGVFLRNWAFVGVVYGALELRLYLQRAQGTRFKYNAAFPAERSGKGFLFGNQTLDNAARTLLLGVPVWSAYEVLVLHAFASGWAPMSAWVSAPVWLIVVALLVPIFHQVHFYLIHRLIHLPFLFRWVHSVHHRAVNPSPWSSLAMHPVELLLYFSGVLIHLVIGSHPLLAIYQLHFAGIGAAVGHIGFHRIELGEDRALDTHAYAHYLHHRYFEVNYGDGLVPMDKWFGTWHDGTPEADRLMEARRARRKKPGMAQG